MRSLTNRQQLGDILHREGINPNTYALDGGHPSERYVLDIRPGGWAVYYSERGLESERREFDSKDEACNYLLDKLRSDPTTHFISSSGHCQRIRPTALSMRGSSRLG